MPSIKCCCNPFKKLNHQKKIKDLRKISKNLKNRFSSFLSGNYICSTCRLKLINSVKNETFDSNYTPSDEVNKKSNALHYLNKCLKALDEPPIKLDKIGSGKKEEILSNLISVLRQKLFDLQKEHSDGDDILKHLKELYSYSENNKDKQMQILKILPQNWGVHKIKTHLSTSYYMAHKAINLIQNNEYITPSIQNHQRFFRNDSNAWKK